MIQMTSLSLGAQGDPKAQREGPHPLPRSKSYLELAILVHKRLRGLQGRGRTLLKQCGIVINRSCRPEDRFN